MEYSIELDHDLKIIRYKHSGFLKYEDIGKAWEEFLQMREFTELKYNLLSDYSDATFNMEMNELPKLLAFLETLEPILRGKKQSLVVSDPFVTAASVIFEGEVNAQIGFKVKVFSTFEAAFEWLV